MRGVIHALVASVVAALAMLLLPTAAHAEGNPDDFSFRSMHVDYVLSRDDDGTSRLQVVETLVAEFPEIDQNRGIRRLIPDAYNSIPLDPQVESVTDEMGAARPMEIDDTGAYLEVVSRADDYLHGAQTYVITYEMTNVVGFFSDTNANEFYWDVNGTGWNQPFGDVSMNLTLEGGLEDTLTGKVSCYAGSYGERGTCTIAQSGPEITSSSGPLDRGGNLTVAVGFEAGTFTVPDTSYFASPGSWVQLGALGVAVAAMGGGIYARRRFMKDDDGHSTVVAQYEPPQGYDAFAAAVLLGKTNGPSAELLEQAVRGSIRLIEEPRRLGKPRMVVQLIDPALAGDADGRDLLIGMFGRNLVPGETYSLSGSDTTFGTYVEGMTTRMKKALDDAGVRRPVSGWARAVPLLISLAAITLAVAGLFLFYPNTPGWGAGLIGIIVMALGFVVTAIIVSRRPFSRGGAQARDHLRGLEMFMEWAEADRITMLQSRSGAERVPFNSQDPREMVRLYEPLLPYAVVFGIEKEWSNLVTRYYADSGYTPTWYVSPNGFTGVGLASAISSTSSSMSSALSSSSSGGSSGGGFSGGGGGGGGGGGV